MQMSQFMFSVLSFVILTEAFTSVGLYDIINRRWAIILIVLCAARNANNNNKTITCEMC